MPVFNRNYTPSDISPKRPDLMKRAMWIILCIGFILPCLLFMTFQYQTLASLAIILLLGFSGFVYSCYLFWKGW